MTELRVEREYFRGKADRLEMMLLSRTYPQTYPQVPRPEVVSTPRRRNLVELQAELTEKELKEEKANGVQK
jgi:hypothetical protein